MVCAFFLKIVFMVAVVKDLCTLNHIECPLDEIFDYLEEFSYELLCLVLGLFGGKSLHKNILPNISIFPIPILVESSGAFLTLGLLLALFNKGGKK